MNRGDTGSGWLSILIAVAAAGMPLLVVAAPDSAADLRTELLSCGAQADDGRRLICYDALRNSYAGRAAGTPGGSAAEAAAVSSTASAAAPVTPSAAAAAGAEAEFGVEHHQSNKTTQAITSAVVQVDRNALGGLVLTLGNDQVWQQSDRARIQIVAGDQVTISRGAMSAFYLRVNDGQRRTRFSRVR